LARQKAAEPRRERYQSTRPAGHPAWAASPPPYDGNYGDGAYAGRSYDDTRPYPPGLVASGGQRYYAEYPRGPGYYGPAYPPPWYNGQPGIPQPEYYRDGYYPERWHRSPMPPW
jgi:hypothetical protein